MDKWLAAALDYVPRWIEFQMQMTEQPGCVVAVAHRGQVVLEQAFGSADLKRGTELTTAHRFRVASHSKTFTATALLKLRDEGRLQLDERIGRYVKELHPQVARVTIAQLLSHTAGLVRDGTDSGQWADRRPFLNEAQIRADLADGPVLDPGSRFKYSNHGYALLGLAIETITGEPYREWVAREVVAASDLEQTLPDAPVPRGVPFARGHSLKLPLGRRVVIAGDNVTGTLASATGFVSTASDLARFFGSLAPLARRSVLSPAARREMSRPQWRDPYSALDRWYGLGTMSGTLGDWNWFGHNGSFQGTLSRTLVLPAQQLSVSVLTNAIDGLAQVWADGIVHLLRTHAIHGAPSRRTAGWSGRFWGLWNAFDLVPLRDKVLAANPALPNPLQDAPELAIERGTKARIVLAGGYAAHGEPARLVRDKRGRATELWLGGAQLLPQARIAQELARRLAPGG